jgi:hypothetical protein
VEDEAQKFFDSEWCCVEKGGHVVVQTVQSLEVEVRGCCHASKYRFENYGE